eukprot:SM000352S13431  [mRNA]  locus=s352:76350:78800:+ [translate_table: standard]
MLTAPCGLSKRLDRYIPPHSDVDVLGNNERTAQQGLGANSLHDEALAHSAAEDRPCGAAVWRRFHLLGAGRRGRPRSRVRRLQRRAAAGLLLGFTGFEVLLSLCPQGSPCFPVPPSLQGCERVAPGPALQRTKDPPLNGASYDGRGPQPGGPLARAGLGATRSHPWRGGGSGKHGEPWGQRLNSTSKPAASSGKAAPEQPPPHSAAGPAAPACVQEVESPPDGGATCPVFRCAMR